MSTPTDKKPDSEITTACGERLTKAARKYPAVKSAAEFFGVARLSEEFAACWHEPGNTDDDRRRLWREYRRELRRAIALNLGVHSSLGGAIHLVINDPRWLLPLVALVYLFIRWLIR